LAVKSKPYPVIFNVQKENDMKRSGKR
jgi:hypothetical protein